MTWLIWKDYRGNRLIVGVALVLLILPYAMAGYAVWRGARELSVIAIAAVYSLFLAQVTLAFFGGNAIAGERMDRSAEFLAYLPVSKGRLLASKLLVGLGLTALGWIPNLLVLASAKEEVMRHIPFNERVVLFVCCAITGLTFFCVAWLFSSMLESPTFSVCAGLITPFVVLASIHGVLYLLEFANPVAARYAALWYCGICLALSAVSFATGTLYYWRRVEP